MFFSALESPPTRESLPSTLSLPDGTEAPLLLVRDRRVRRLRLTVTERGVRLSVPWRVADRVAQAFLFDHRNWVAEQWGRLRDTRQSVEWQFGAVTHLPLFGLDQPVVWLESRSARVERVAPTPVAMHDAMHQPAVHFHAPRQASAASLRRAVLEFYTAEARAAVHQWLPTYLPELPRAPREFRIRALSSLWGSLSPDGRVSLDLALVLGPPSALEYVLVHELCHLIHANHAPVFWHEVERRCPDWRTERARLRSDAGLGLKAQLRALTRA